MLNPSLAQNKNRLNPYLLKEILEATPQQLLIKTFDFAIVNCQRHNLEKTNAALQQLINALSFETEEVKNISIGFLRLYTYCQDQMRKKNYDEVIKILTELRNEWMKAFNM